MCMAVIGKIKYLRFPQIFNMTRSDDIDPSIWSLGDERRYQAGTVLLRIGEIPKHIYYLHEGTVYCYRAAYDKMNLTYILKNGFFADCWYFGQQESEDEVIVEEESRITKFSHAMIDQLLAHPGLARKIMHTLALKSIQGMDLAENIRNKSVKERLKGFIDQQFLQAGAELALTLNLSQKDIAALMGVHPVSISRALTELKKEMTILTSKNQIIIQRQKTRD